MPKLRIKKGRSEKWRVKNQYIEKQYAGTKWVSSVSGEEMQRGQPMFLQELDWGQGEKKKQTDKLANMSTQDKQKCY